MFNSKNKVKKILHIVPSYYPAFKYGGPIESVRELNKALFRKGIEIDVLTTNAGLENGSKLLKKEWVYDDGVRIKYLPSYFYEHYTFSPQLMVDSIIAAKNYDLIHITAFWNFPTLAGSLASLISKKPYIISPRGVLYEDAINIKSKNLKKLYYFLVARHYLSKANAVHFTTADEELNLAKFIKLRGKRVIVPNGLDLSKFNNLPSRGLLKEKYPVLKGKKILLFLGRINKQKGISLLLDAFYLLSNNYNDLYLVIAGPDNDNYCKEIKTQLRKKNLIDRVIFTGLLKDDEKFSAYIDSDVFILPSYFENFGMSVIEAMACGTPVVISNKVGISREVKKDNAGIIVEVNAESLANGIKQIIEEPQMAKKISENAKKLVYSNYDVNKVADMMICAYENVLATKET